MGNLRAGRGSFRPKHPPMPALTAPLPLPWLGRLQTTMEAEIRTVLTGHVRGRGSRSHADSPPGSMPLRSFLARMVAVAARDPTAFLAALHATCTIKETCPPFGTATRVVLLKRKGPSGVGTAPAPATAAGGDKEKDSAGANAAIPAANAGGCTSVEGGGSASGASPGCEAQQHASTPAGRSTAAGGEGDLLRLRGGAGGRAAGASPPQPANAQPAATPAPNKSGELADRGGG
jgi:hypothetical protein